MMSGGHQKNIFNISMGSSVISKQREKEIQALISETQKLSDELTELKNADLD